ncbi:MAG: PAS domain S-box protein, partial [candidate division Zixibacteria bacterium]|nr:PAS domain S-box protein [candidate division Zixibacteria bacterium]
LVTGVHPFRRNSADETVQAISGGIVQPAGKYHSGLPESFSRIIERSLERDRHMRYQRVGDMLHDISIEIGGRVMLESEARYRSLNDDVLDSSWVGTCILDSEFRVVWINRALERYFCLRREDVIGEDWPRLIETSVKSLVEGGDDLVRRIRTALTDNAYIERFEFHLLPSERCQERWLEHWSQPIRSGVYAGGRIEHYSDFSDRVQTLMALRESEDKYRSLVVNAADGIAIVQESRITFANPGLAAILGRPVEELVDSPFSEHVHPDDLERCERLYNHQVAHSEGVQQAEVQLLSSGGRRLDTEVSVATVTIKRQPAVLAVVRDVTTRKHSEKLLRLEQERAQRYLNIAATIIVAIDADECVGLINKKGCEVLGLPETEIVGRNWFDSFVPADIRGEVRAGFRQLMNGDTKPMEFYDNPIVNADGEHRLIAWNNTIIRDDDGNIQGTLSSGTDVTDRRRVEDAYRESAATLQSVFLAAPIGIGLVNNRVLGWVNDRLCQMTGYSREELEGQNALKLYETTEEFERVGIVKHGEIRRSGLGTVETRWVRKDGGVMDIILSSSAIDPSDLSRGLVFTALDITARKQTDDMLKKATEHLKREHLALVEKNIALKQVLDHMENDRRGDKDQVATDIEDVLMPIVDRLKRRAEGDIVKDVEALEMSMRRVLSRGDDDFQRRLADLTPREREICDLIREGVSSKDISERLILSVATIHKHREQIRKKLGIANVSVDLRDYLRRT